MYSLAYANLCRVLSPVKVEWTQDGETKFTTFRRVLLTKCQREFEKHKKDETCTYGNNGRMLKR